MRNNNDLSWKFGKSKENLSLSREVKEGEESCTRKDKADKEGGQTSGQM